jgi:hypothetical protein
LQRVMQSIFSLAARRQQYKPGGKMIGAVAVS